MSDRSKLKHLRVEEYVSSTYAALADGLSSSGLLYLLNAVVLHAHGYELTTATRGGATAGFALLRRRSGRFTFTKREHVIGLLALVPTKPRAARAS